MRRLKRGSSWVHTLALCAALAFASACGGADSDGGGGDTEPINGDLNGSGDGITDTTGQQDGTEDTGDGLSTDTSGDTVVVPPDGLNPDGTGGDVPDGASLGGHEPFTCDGIDNDGDGLTDEDCSFLLVGGLFGAGHALGTDNEGNALEHTLSTPTFSGTSEGGGYRLTPVGPGATP